ncbi:MAG: BT_3928 family protein [Bacteroidota bacterium]
MKILTQFSRIFVGVLFIISGFIKANDTLGFSYKLEEYFEIFQKEFPLPKFLFLDWMSFSHHAAGLSMFICIFEIMVGVALLLGAYSRLNAWLLLLMMVFFTILTAYSAITHKVTDCGCFGDAIKFTPFGSFMKDVVLMFFSVFIFIGHKHIKDIFGNKVYQNLALFVALIVTTFFTFYTYMFLPRIDFLPYKVGNDIRKMMEYPEGALRDSVEMVFIYEKDGKQIEIAMNDIGKVDSTYKFIDRKDKVIREGYRPPITGFKIYDAGGIEYTDSLLNDKDYQLIFVQKDINDSRKNMEPIVAMLAEKWQLSGKKFWALTASPLNEVEIYRHEHQLAFPYYNMDATPLKSIVRSNPGLILMHGTVVVKKWSAFNIPVYEIVEKYMK